MDLLNNLFFGFSVALSLQNLLYCLIGVSVGTLIGVPGIGPLATIAMFLPLTYNVGPVGALIMLAGFITARNTALDHGDPGQPAAKPAGCHLHRRLSMAQPGPRRPAASRSPPSVRLRGTRNLMTRFFGPPLADSATH